MIKVEVKKYKYKNCVSQKIISNGSLREESVYMDITEYFSLLPTCFY